MECKECKKELPVSKKPNKTQLCKNCYSKQYKSLNQKEEKLRNLNYYNNNRQKIRDRKREYARNRKKNDLNFRLKENLRTRLVKALRKGYKSGSTILNLGCSIEEFKKHLESKFQEGMSWGNYGEWHIDHIKPLCKFDLTNEVELRVASHYSNLQPLWAKDNMEKRHVDGTF